jgi:hypothetical protein
MISGIIGRFERAGGEVSRIRGTAEGGYLECSEPVFLVGKPGTGRNVSGQWAGHRC